MFLIRTWNLLYERICEGMSFKTGPNGWGPFWSRWVIAQESAASLQIPWNPRCFCRAGTTLHGLQSEDIPEPAPQPHPGSHGLLRLCLSTGVWKPLAGVGHCPWASWVSAAGWVGQHSLEPMLSSQEELGHRVCAEVRSLAHRPTEPHACLYF